MTTFREMLKGAKVSLDYWRIDPYGDGPDGLTPGDGMFYSDLDAVNRANADAFGHRSLSGSDYCGGAVARANIATARKLLAKYPEAPVVFAHGGHGTEAVIFLADRDAPEEAVEAFVALVCVLEDYPVADEDELSETGEEDAAERWQNGAGSDFARALAKRIIDTDSDAALSTHDVSIEFGSADGRELFAEFGGEVEHDNEGAHFDVERAASKVSPVVLFALRIVRLEDYALFGLAADDAPAARCEARRLDRLRRLGDALRWSVERKLADSYGKADSVDVRRALLACRVDAGDTARELQANLPAELLRATATFPGWAFKPDYTAPDVIVELVP